MSPTAQAPDAFDEIVQRVFGLSRVDRQSGQAIRCGFCHRELAFAETALLESGGVVQRGVVRADFNAFLEEHRVDEVISIQAKLLGANLDGIKVEYVFAAGADGWQLYSGHVAQARGKVSGVVNAALVEGVQLVQL